MIPLSVTEPGQARLGGDGDAGRLPPAAFYCVSSSMYFLGAVALVNSLRLLGHAEPIFVLDYGLSTAERELLSQEATLVAAPDDTTPFLLKTVAPLAHPAEVMVLIDADIIITRPIECWRSSTARTGSFPTGESCWAFAAQSIGRMSPRAWFSRAARSGGVWSA